MPTLIDRPVEGNSKARSDSSDTAISCEAREGGYFFSHFLKFLSLEDRAKTYGYFRAVNGYGLR